jgi:outer membrane lipoprotein carrier protein
MKVLYKTIFTLFVIALFTNIQARPQGSDYMPVTDKQTTINNFRSKQKSTSTFSCLFRQVKYISYLSAQIESSGKFYYKSTNSIRWEYLEPYQYAIIINEGKLKIDGNNNDIQYKIRENKYIEKLNDIIQDSFCGDIYSNDSYKTLLEEGSNDFRLKLIPKEEEIKNIITMVYLHFDKQNLSVSKIIIHEPTKDYTSLSFSDHIYNQPIDINKFR